MCDGSSMSLKNFWCSAVRGKDLCTLDFMGSSIERISVKQHMPYSLLAPVEPFANFKSLIALDSFTHLSSGLAHAIWMIEQLPR